MNKRQLALKIKKSRNEARLSQGELGKLVGLTDKSISAYEAGRAVPPLDVLEKVSQAVGKPLAFFINMSSENEAQFTITAKLTAVEKELKEIKKLLKNR